MRSSQARQLEKLVAIRDFLDLHAAHLPEVSVSPARQKLDALIEKLHAAAGGQHASRTMRTGQTQRYQELRKILVRHHMAPIVLTARSALIDDAGLRTWALPKGNPHPVQLAGMARGLAQVASAHKEMLIAAGLRPDFEEDLRVAADAMEDAYKARNGFKSNSRLATTTIPSALKDATTIVRLLSALVQREAADNVELLLGWTALAAPRRLPRLAATIAPPALPTAPAMKALPAPSPELLAPLGRLFGNS